MAETKKAKPRRIREGFFEKYVRDPGIDIGCAYAPGHPADALNDTFRRYDILYGDGDAQLMADVPDETFQTVYASHILEHLNDPVEAIRNWYRILKPGGYLIIVVPHAALYEKQYTLPSRWNADHRTLWLPTDREVDDVIADYPQSIEILCSLERVVISALEGEPYEIVSLRTLDEGYTANLGNHAGGEYSIEIIVRKPL